MKPVASLCVKEFDVQKQRESMVDFACHSLAQEALRVLTYTVVERV